MNRLKNKKFPKFRAARMSVLVVVAICLVSAIIADGAMTAKQAGNNDGAGAASTVTKMTAAAKQVAPKQAAIKSESAQTLNGDIDGVIGTLAGSLATPGEEEGSLGLAESVTQNSDIAIGKKTSAETLSVYGAESEVTDSAVYNASGLTDKAKKAEKVKKAKKAEKAKKAKKVKNAKKAKKAEEARKAKKATATLKATWYTGDVLGFRGSGGALEHGESIALNAYQRQSLGLKYGQKVYLKFPGSFKKLNGWYEIKDSGCASGIVDMFYKSKGSVPSNFKSAGVVRSVKLYKETKTKAKKKKKIVGKVVSE